MNKLPTHLGYQFGQVIKYLKSEQNIGSLRKPYGKDYVLSCDPTDFENTIYHEQALEELQPIYAKVEDNTIIVFGSTFKRKEYLKSIGFRYKSSPHPHWHTTYSGKVAHALNKQYNLNLEITQDTKIELSVAKTKVFVKNANSKIHNTISKKLTYRDLNADWNTNPNWDGYWRLFDWRTKSAPIGFLSQIKETLKELNEEFTINDNRKQTTHLPLTWNGVTLRDYQEKTVNDCYETKMNFISSPTGTGKTEIAMGLINKIQANTLIIVHKKELLYQWQKRLSQTFGIEIGIIGDNKYDEKNITVATLQTVHKKLPQNNYDVLIVDEAHHITAKTFYEFSANLNALYRYGLSATPFREDGHEMKLFAHVGSLYESITVKEAISRGFLVQPTFEVLEGSSVRYPRRKRNWLAERRDTCLDLQVNNRIVDRAIDLLNEGRFVYIDVLLINHGSLLVKLFAERNVPVDFIHGTTKTANRLEVLSNFEKGGRILISTLIKEGVDLPIMDTIILAGTSKSFIENLQKIGRILRLKPNGVETALVIDRQDYGNYTSEWFHRRQSLMKRYYG